MVVAAVVGVVAADRATSVTRSSVDSRANTWARRTTRATAARATSPRRSRSDGRRRPASVGPGPTSGAVGRRPAAAPTGGGRGRGAGAGRRSRWRRRRLRWWPRRRRRGWRRPSDAGAAVRGQSGEVEDLGGVGAGRRPAPGSGTIVGTAGVTRAAPMAAAEGNRAAGSGSMARSTARTRASSRSGRRVAEGDVVARGHGPGGDHGVVALERLAPDQSLVEDHPEGVEVGEGRRRVAAQLLGGEVGGGADELAGAGEVGAHLEALGDAEVGDLGRPLAREQDVARLHVAVHHPHVVGGVEGAQHLAAEGPGLGLASAPGRWRCGRRGCRPAGAP